jgi:hypothetical protein
VERFSIVISNLALGNPMPCLQYYYLIENEVKRMKELYLNAEMDVVKFAASDVITTSATTGGDAGNTETTWVPRVNEGAPDFNAFDGQ